MFYFVLFLAGCVAFWLTSFLDFKSSSQQTSHGLSENDLWGINRDEYGYFSPTNFWKYHIIYFGVWTGLALLLYFLEDNPKDKNLIAMFMALIGYFPVAIAMLLTYFKNNKKALVGRKVQIEILRTVAAQPTYDHGFMDALFATYGFWKRTVNGRVRAVMFPWLYRDGGDAGNTFEESFYQAIYELARRGEAQWFVDTSLRKLP